MQYLLLLLNILKQLFGQKGVCIIMLTSLSLAIFLLRQWHTVQTSPETPDIK